MVDRTGLAIAGSLGAIVAAVVTGLPAGAVTPSPSPSPSVSVSPSASPSITPSATPTATPSLSPSPSSSPTPSASATTPSPTVSAPATTAPTQPARPVPVPLPTRTIAPTPTLPPVPAPVLTALSRTRGHASASRTVTATGSQLTNLQAVSVGGAPARDLVVLSPTTVRFVLPASLDFQAKAAPVTLTAVSDRVTRPTALTFTYVVSSRVDRQMAYAFQNWNAYSNKRFGYLSGNDCANFTSQTLLARGWATSTQWFNRGAGRWSGTWVSSTALSTWLTKRKDLAQHLLYRQRDQAVVGDIVQFRWPGHKKGYSSWDHTAVVSKVVVQPDGHHDVYYVAHTNNRQYGGSTGVLARSMAKTLRIQFFHLKR